MLNAGNCTDPIIHMGEVVNDVCIKVQGSWNSLRKPEVVINKITANTARTHARKCRREPPQEIYETAIPLFSKGAQDPTEIYEKALLVKELLSQLEPPVQEMFFLLFEGWTYAEIEVLLRVPGGTLRSWYSRAVKQLKRGNLPLADYIRSDSIGAATD
jgi:DNA-directed RNA polymerase specialized sigma24 family protein